ncbi:MAG: ester cyclase [Nakamurella sp.]
MPLDAKIVAAAHAAYCRGDGGSLLGLLSDEVYDNVSRQAGKQIWTVVLNWMKESFGDVSVEVNMSAADGDRVMIWLTVTGTHIGSSFPWMRGRPASGRAVTWRQVHIYRVTATQAVEHWAVRDDLRVLEAIDGPAGNG